MQNNGTALVRQQVLILWSDANCAVINALWEIPCIMKGLLLTLIVVVLICGPKECMP